MARGTGGDRAVTTEANGARASVAHDLFLSYNRPDYAVVEVLRRLLEARGVATFLDRYQLVAGLPWGRALEEALRDVRGVAVFLGSEGLGTWQAREMWFALERQAQEETAGRPFPVVPVLLPGVPPSELTSRFLFQNTWIDLRADPTDPEMLDALTRAVRGELPQATRPRGPRACPYLSLRAFREQDAAFFFGREAFAERLGEAALIRNLVAVVGPSGSGKSSVVQAGLLPRLRRRGPPHATWDAAVFTPGDRPFHRLAAQVIPLLESSLSETDRLTEAKKLGDLLAVGDALLEDVIARVLAKSNGTDRLLLVVDQFEELFTVTPEESRAPFGAALLAALDRAPVTLVLTLRADFYGHASGLSRALSDRLEQGVVNLGAMRPDELERAIVEPVRRVGLAFEAGLAQRILDDVGAEPGNLPLLEFALTELWARTPAGPLTHASYEATGRVIGAITRRAEEEYSRFTPEQQQAARRVFSLLVRVGRLDEAGEDTGRRAVLAELARPTADGSGPAELVVVRALAAAGTRLLVTGRDTVTGQETVQVAHEALIRSWERLRGWLDQDREFLMWRQRVRTELGEWKRMLGDQEVLLHGVLLTEGERWLTQRSDDLSSDEQRYIQESMQLRESEQSARERLWRRIIVAALAAALVGLLLAGFAGWQWWRAEEQRGRADRRSADVRRLANTTLFGLLDEIPNLSETMEARRLIIEGMVTYLDSLADEGRDDLDLQREVAMAYQRLGDAVRNANDSGRSDTAEAAQESYRRTIQILERLIQADPTDATAQRDLGTIYIKIGDVQADTGDTGRALASYRRALAIGEHLDQTDPSGATARYDLGVGHARIGDVQRATGDTSGALASYRRTIQILERLIQADPTDATAQRDLGSSYSRIGDVQMATGDTSGALASYQQALAIAERLAQADPTSAQAQRDLSLSHERLGNAHRVMGNTSGALASYQQALAIAERLPQADPTNVQAQRDLDRIRATATDAQRRVANP